MKRVGDQPAGSAGVPRDPSSVPPAGPASFRPDPWVRFASIFALLVLLSEASYYAFMEQSTGNQFITEMAHLKTREL